MKRALALAAFAVGLVVFAGTSDATARDYLYGGHRGHHGGYCSGGYAPASSQAYPGYGYGANYGRHPNAYGYGQTYQSQYRSPYTPSYPSRNHGQYGGLHLDIGRFHIFGIGGHHR